LASDCCLDGSICSADNVCVAPCTSGTGGTCSVASDCCLAESTCSADNTCVAPCASTGDTCSVASDCCLARSTCSADNTCVAPAATPDVSCGNAGLQWAFYSEASLAALDDFNNIKLHQPIAAGVTSALQYFAAECPNPDSEFTLFDATESCLYFFVDYRGYIYAGQTGSYTFTISSVDDNMFIWAGPEAYSGWTHANTVTALSGAVSGTATGNFNAVRGDYIPVRIVWSQANGPYYFGVQVTAPDGTMVLDETDSSLVVQFSCDGTTAPPYESYGQET
jgi:hypothetical protein